MKIIFIPFFILFSLSFSDQEKGSEAKVSSDIILTEPSEIAALLVSNFNDYKTYTSSFKEYSRGRVKRGLIRLVKPDMFRVDYFDANRNTTIEIYSDSEKLFVYLKKINIVCEQDLVPDRGEVAYNKDEEDLELAPILVNLDRLIRSYNFNFKESKRMVEVLNDSDVRKFKLPVKKSIKAYHFSLTPRDKTLGLNHMELWISKEGIVRRCKSITLDKKEIDFLFYETKMDKIIPASTFEFEIPANAQVIKNVMMEFEKSGSDVESEEQP